MKSLIDKSPRFIFFTGKGGVGKTTLSCSTAVALSDQGKKVLLISTDPASNLDELLATKLSNSPVPITGQENLHAMNIDPIEAAQNHKERVLEPYRGILPDDAIQSMEEQLSGACTVEIASFNEFSKIIADEETVSGYDHVILDTAPTGHTLRLLKLPSAWRDFILENKSGNSCLGAMSGLEDQRVIYEKAVSSLSDSTKTLLVLVTRAESLSLQEASKASSELGALGMNNQHLVINGIFSSESDDDIALSFAKKSSEALSSIPESLLNVPQSRHGFVPKGLTGIESFKQFISGSYKPEEVDQKELLSQMRPDILSKTKSWDDLIPQLAGSGTGLIMTMGKGGVGKTTTACALAVKLAHLGHKVHLSTTDPASHVHDIIGTSIDNLHVTCIDPKVESEKYVQSVIDANRGTMNAEDLELLEEELRSPCIEEVAIFNAFAKTVSKGCDGLVILDTAPTGHTLLLLDATESFHKEVNQSTQAPADEVKQLLPRLRNPDFTKILITTLPEATPVHEAERLQKDLIRADIKPYSWIINQCFSATDTQDPVLTYRCISELGYISEVCNEYSSNVAVIPWSQDENLYGHSLKRLLC